MAHLQSALRVFILLALLIVPFLTFEENEQSPFELPKLVFLSFVTAFAAAIYVLQALKENVWKFKWNHALNSSVIILIATVLSYQTSNNQFNSFWGNNNVPTDGLWSVLIFLVFYFLITQLFDTNKRLFKLDWAILSSIFVLACYGIVQHFGYDPIDWWGYAEMRTAAYGTIGQSVGYSTIVGAVIPLAAFYFFKQKQNLKIFLTGTMLAVLMLGQMYSGSRTPVALTVLMTSALGLIYFFKDRSVLKNLTLYFVILVSVQTVYFSESGTAIEKKMQSQSLNSGIRERVQVWMDGVEIWKKYPILGSGPETFALELKQVNTKDFNTNSKWALYWHKAHNFFFHYLATLGLVGLAAHLLFLFSAVYWVWVEFRRPPSEDKKQKSDVESYKGLAYLFIPIFIYLSNITAFYFVLTQLYCGLFFVLYFVNKAESGTINLQIKFPKNLNYLNMVLIVIILGLFSMEIWKFWRADRYFSLARYSFEGSRDVKGALENIDKALITKHNDCRFYIRKANYLSNAFRMEFKRGNLRDPGYAVENVNAVLEAATDCDPKGPETWFFKGKILTDLFMEGLSRDLGAARYAFLQGEKYSPANPIFKYSLAVVYGNEGNLGQFVYYMQAAIDLKTDYFPAYAPLMEQYYKLNKNSEITKLVEKIESVQVSTPDMVSELVKTLELAKKNNDTAHLNRLAYAYRRLYTAL